MRRLRPVALGVAALACNLEGDVAHDGDYVFLPAAPRADTAPRALDALLVVETDAALEKRRYYYFQGELGPLGIGLESLPHVLARDGRYALLFENPFDAYDRRSDDPDGSGGAGGARAGTEAEAAPTDPNTSGEGPALEVDGQDPVPLEPLATTDLTRVGAARFAGALESGKYTARAYLGRASSAEPYARIRVTERSSELLTLDTELSPSAPEALREEDALRLDPAPLARPDYLIIDLYQELTRGADALPLEAVLRISVAPSTPYTVTSAGLSTTFDALCWSKDRPLYARVTQVARQVVKTPHGTSAFIERRADRAEIPSETWSELVTAGEPRGYCADYR